MTDKNQTEINKQRPTPKCPPWVHLVAGGYVLINLIILIPNKDIYSIYETAGSGSSDLAR